MQAYLDNIKAKTGLTPDDFKRLAAEKGLSKYPELMIWLKSEYGLGHGHANLIAQLVSKADEPKITRDERIDKHFSGAKAAWRKPYDDLLAKLKAFGGDVSVAPTNTYLSILRGKNKFAIVAITANRLDLGIKLKGAPFEGRFEEAANWNAMVTHRVRIETPTQIDEEIIDWLRQAYDKA